MSSRDCCCRHLTRDEHEALRDLKATYLATRSATENLLPLGVVLRAAGALLLSAITVFVTAFAQQWIASAVARFAP